MKNVVNDLLRDIIHETTYRSISLTHQPTSLLIKAAFAAGLAGLSVLALGDIPQQHLDALATGEWSGGCLTLPIGKPAREILLAVQQAPLNLPALAAVMVVAGTFAVRWTLAGIMLLTLLVSVTTSDIISRWTTPGPDPAPTWRDRTQLDAARNQSHSPHLGGSPSPAKLQPMESNTSQPEKTDPL